MKTNSRSSHRFTRLVRACLALAGPFAIAAIAAPIPATQIPELFAGEIDDVGPQYLLVPTAAAQPLDLWSEIEVTGTSNATLVESNPEFSTITSLQAGGTARLAQRTWPGGVLVCDTGFRLQTYRYGLLADRKRKINFLEIDRNDFDLLGAHLQATWRRTGWLAIAALRGASLRNRANDRVFYQEGSAEWQVFRHWPAGARRAVITGFEGATRWSHTDSFGLLPAGWNNRVEQGFVVVFDQSLGARWRLQPAARVQGSYYTHRERNRRDLHGSARVMLVRAFGERAELRVGGGYDQRESSEAVIADFRKWDFTLAGGAHWRF